MHPRCWRSHANTNALAWRWAEDRGKVGILALQTATQGTWGTSWRETLAIRTTCYALCDIVEQRTQLNFGDDACTVEVIREFIQGQHD